MAYWLDYSAAKLTGSVIKAAGYTGVIRYLDSPERLSTKHTNRSEFESHKAAGLSIMMVMQTSTTASDGGFATGVDHARRALAGANHLGYTGPIFFTNDRTTVPNPSAWRGYLDGAASILGRARTGAYGFRNAMDLAVGRASYFWQAGRRSDVAGHTHIWQDNNTQVTVGGVLCDRNLILKDLEDDMPTAREIADELLNTPLDMGWKRPGQTENHKATVRTVLSWTDLQQQATSAQLAALAGQVAGLAVALQQIRDDEDLDTEAVFAAAEAGTKKALAENTVHVDIDVTGPNSEGN